jgi:hypothetical protein
VRRRQRDVVQMAPDVEVVDQAFSACTGRCVVACLSGGRMTETIDSGQCHGRRAHYSDSKARHGLPGPHGWRTDVSKELDPMMRVEDALHATRAAVEEGIVPGESA